MHLKMSQPSRMVRVFLVLILPIALTSWYAVALSFGEGCTSLQLAGNSTLANVGIAPRSVVAADFNHDGNVDLATANFGSSLGAPDGSLSILLNNGSGGFLAPTNLTSGINPRSIVTADFNKDTHPDLAVLHYADGNCCISTFATIFLGNASGGFAAAGPPLSVGNEALTLAVGDFNKDTNPDLVAAVQLSGVALLPGGGNGTFGAVQLFTGVGSPQSISVADINGDTNLDVVVSSTLNTNLNALLGNGSGGFEAPKSSTTGAFSFFVALGDFNEDSRIDAAVGTSNSIRVLRGDGAGNFGNATDFPVFSQPQSLLVRDFNSDGHLDLVSTHSGSGTVSVLLGNGLGGFTAFKSYVASEGSFFAASSDVNSDTKIDLAVANSSANNVSILTGDGAGGFSGARAFPAGLVPLAVAGGDLNGDGKNDLVVGGSENTVSVFLNTGAGSFAPQTKFPSGSAHDVVLEDFNSDGKLDVVIVDLTQANLLIGNGNGGFSFPLLVLNNISAFALTSGDFNKDGKADLAIPNNGAQNLLILFGNGRGGFSNPTSIPLSIFPFDIESTDVNGDGNIDLIVAGGQVFVLLGSFGGNFSMPIPLPIVGARKIAVGDANGDGFVDVLAASEVGNHLSLSLGNGSGGFSPETTFPVDDPDPVAFGDFNSDGKTDLATSDSDFSLVVFPGNGNGTFGAAESLTAGIIPRGLLPIELNDDGRTDVAVANSSGYLSVLLNTCTATPATLPALSISDVTIVEGNSGQTNATFTVSLSAPSNQTVTVSFHSLDVTATGGSDYQIVSGRFTFPPGTTSQTLLVPVQADNVPEANESFNLKLFNPLNASISKAKGTATINSDDGALITFNAADFVINENGGSQEVVILRFGDLSGTTTLNYATSDTAGSAACSATTGAASSRCDYLRTLGSLTFTAGESSKSISIPIVDDVFNEGVLEMFLVTLSNISGGTLGQSNATITIVDNDFAPAPNPIDNVNFFVRQQYLDFLNREPDTAGFNFWIGEFPPCGSDQQCIEIKRINVSAAFFLSIEFQETGYLVYRFYKSGFGNLPGAPVPVTLIDFLRDTQRIGQGVQVNVGDWQAKLEANKQAFALAFVQRADFVAAFPNSMTATDFVNQLNTRAGGVLNGAEQTNLINILGATPSDVTKRAQVLRAVAEDTDLKNAEFNKAFVLMQYFGYLRRNPNDAPDGNFSGFDFWLTKLNQFNGNFVNAEMVKAFISSLEYRQRFGP